MACRGGRPCPPGPSIATLCRARPACLAADVSVAFYQQTKALQHPPEGRYFHQNRAIRLRGHYVIVQTEGPCAGSAHLVGKSQICTDCTTDYIRNIFSKACCIGKIVIYAPIIHILVLDDLRERTIASVIEIGLSNLNIADMNFPVAAHTSQQILCWGVFFFLFDG